MTIEELRQSEEDSMGREATLLDAKELYGGVRIAVVELAPLQMRSGRTLREVRCALWTPGTPAPTSLVVAKDVTGP